MKIAIIGSGAMGCRFGVGFSDASAEVWLYDIWAEHIAAIHGRGLIIHDGLGGVRQVHLNAVTEIAAIPQPDVLVIFTKSMHTHAAMDQSKSLLGPATTVLTFQNGLGNIEAIRAAAGDVPIIAGVTNYASDLIGPGEVELKGSGVVKMMALDERAQETAARLLGLLQASGYNAAISPDVLVDIWEKVAFNAALNTVTAVTGLSVGGSGSTPEGRALLFDIAAEVTAVANSLGIEADKVRACSLIESVFDPRMSGDHKTSMLQDRLAHRKTEIEAVCGQVILHARAAGVPVPHVETMYALVRSIEENYSRLSFS